MKTEIAAHCNYNKYAFKNYLVSETELLNVWFKREYFKTEGLKVGAEIEFLLLDTNYHLTPQNQSFTQQLNDPNVIPEAGASQLEINTAVFPLCDSFLSDLHQSVLSTWSKCCCLARKNNAHLALIGSMPQAEEYHSAPEYITPHPSYQLMNDNVSKYRQGRPLSLKLNGAEEEFMFQPQSLSVEGLISSLQLHLEVSPEQSVIYYNIMQMLSAPLLSLCANAPFFYGKELWSESRIAIFEQLYAFPSPYQNCVFFEPHYLKNSFFSLFKANLNNYPHLLPEVAQEEPRHHLFHLRKQNSTVYRWNRPIVDFNSHNEPYLRIEHRPLSSGPSIVDMIANAAFFYGLVYFFANQNEPEASLIPFKESYANFYQAACSGLRARFMWNGIEVDALHLLNDFLPLAKKGLEDLGIVRGDIDYYLEIIHHRLLKQQNGSIWQQNFIKHYGYDFENLLGHYLENQYREIPISEWPI
ncbi:hypothetical protein [Legionella quinlivanii]|uniref:hypothetical protein n=1 Tax=Legionella quinlivanii TaxID=45073 RepID=UPI002244EC0D|nr:hypothetical protein [Legionella quinlivanii]MCW8451853.1 hypothetical protein [Legionella quinlivanii]